MKLFSYIPFRKQPCCNWPTTLLHPVPVPHTITRSGWEVVITAVIFLKTYFEHDYFKTQTQNEKFSTLMPKFIQNFHSYTMHEFLSLFILSISKTYFLHHKKFKKKISDAIQKHNSTLTYIIFSRSSAINLPF